VFTSRKSVKSSILFKAFTAEARVYPVLSISTVSASSGLDRQRPVVNSAAAEGFSSLGSESRMNTCSTTDVQNVNNEAQSNFQIALCVVAVNHILKTIGWLNLHPYLQGFVSLRVDVLCQGSDYHYRTQHPYKLV
jgi:hypothetical protein